MEHALTNLDRLLLHPAAVPDNHLPAAPLIEYIHIVYSTILVAP